MVCSVLIVGNINWFNLREKHIKPLLDKGIRVTVLSDLPPLKEEYINDISFIQLNNPSHSNVSIFFLAKLLLGLLISGKLFNKKEIKRLKFVYENSLMFINQISNIAFNEYDIVDCHFLTRPVCMATIFTNVPIPLVATIHGSDLYVSSKHSYTDLQVLKRFFNQCIAIRVPGSAEKKFSAALGCDATKLSITPWCVNESNFYPPVNRKIVDELRTKWEINISSKVILSVRNLSPIYNIESIIKAFEAYAEGQYKNSVLLIVGEGKQLSKLKVLASTINSPKRIKFLGKLKPNQLLDIYQISDVYIQNSLSDALPYSILESIACGLPIVCGEVGSISDIKTEINKASIDNFFYSHPGPLENSDLDVLLRRSIKESEKKYASDTELHLSIYSQNTGMERLEYFYQQAIESKPGIV